MKAVKIILAILVLLILVVSVMIGVTAKGVGDEADKLKTAMEQDVAGHATMDDVLQHLAALNITPQANGAASVTGMGQHHSVLVYSTWLTVEVGFDPDKKARSYHMDRVSAWLGKASPSQ